MFNINLNLGILQQEEPNGKDGPGASSNDSKDGQNEGQLEKQEASSNDYEKSLTLERPKSAPGKQIFNINFNLRLL